MTVAIAAIDIAFFINLKPDAGVPQCAFAAVTSHAARVDNLGLGGVDGHGGQSLLADLQSCLWAMASAQTST